jgi:hypothetical protein
VLADGEILSERRVTVLPERRLAVSIAAALLAGVKALSVVLD